MNAAASQPARPQQVPRTPVFTYSLIALNVLVFVAMLLAGVSFTDPNAEVLIRWGANHGPFTLDGQWWRLVTAMFLHIGIVHVSLNMWALFSVGRLAEDLYGGLIFLLIYFTTGLCGGMASLLWNPIAVSAGASGAIFGVIGALIATLLIDRIHIRREAARPVLLSLVVFTAYNLAFGFFDGRTDNGAHVGGLVSGLALGAALAHFLVRSRRSLVARQITFTFAVLVLVALGFAVERRSGYVVGIEQARRKMVHGDYKGAMAELQPVAKKAPNNATIRLLLGDAYFRQGLLPQAESEFKQVVAIQPNNAGAWSNLGQVNLLSDRLEEADAAFQKAAQANPKDAHTWYSIGFVAQRREKFADAVNAYQKALQITPAYVDAAFQLGICEMNLKHYDEAITAFRRVVQLQPANPDAQTWLGNAYQAKGMRAEAETAFVKAAQIRAAMGRQRR